MLVEFASRGLSVLWRDAKRNSAAYLFYTSPPFRLVNAKSNELIPLRRCVREEETSRLVFEGSTDGMCYKLTVYSREVGPEIPHVDGQLPTMPQIRHNKQVRNEARVLMTLERWRSGAKEEEDSEYRVMLYG